MSQLERITKLTAMLENSHFVRRDRLLSELDVSLSTLKRDIRFLQMRQGYPVFYDAAEGAYRRQHGAPAEAGPYAIPRFQLKADEVHALLTMQHLLSSLDAGGLLGRHIGPWMRRVAQMLDKGSGSACELTRRIRVASIGARRLRLEHYQPIASALLRRKRMVIRYHSRSTDQTGEREVSPQRLIHYRGNWYLDAWCHQREALRSFSVDAIEHVHTLDQTALDMDDGELDAVLGSGYGIFSGRHVTWAGLRFSAERSRWVAAETWHPEQRGRYDSQGRWVLELPYSDPTELVMDILRHVPEVEVLWPEELERVVEGKLKEGLRRMGAALDE